MEAFTKGLRAMIIIDNYWKKNIVSNVQRKSKKSNYISVDRFQQQYHHLYFDLRIFEPLWICNLKRSIKSSSATTTLQNWSKFFLFCLDHFDTVQANKIWWPYSKMDHFLLLKQSNQKQQRQQHHHHSIVFDHLNHQLHNYNVWFFSLIFLKYRTK